MKKILAEYMNEDCNLYCPNCDYWESMGRDDPRKRYHAIPVLEWNDNDTSIHKCSNCDEKFIVVWEDCDMLEHYELLPEKVNAILNSYDLENLNVDEIKVIQQKLNALGWIVDREMSGGLINLRQA
jgi:hypothetical protein